MNESLEIKSRERKFAVFYPKKSHPPDSEIVRYENGHAIVKIVRPQHGIAGQDNPYTLAEQFPPERIVAFRHNIWSKTSLVEKNLAETTEAGIWRLADELTRILHEWPWRKQFEVAFSIFRIDGAFFSLNDCQMIFHVGFFDVFQLAGDFWTHYCLGLLQQDERRSYPDWRRATARRKSS